MNPPEDTSLELYLKYRPRKLSSIVGQESAVAVLNKLIEKGKIPHCILFTGPSGCGKTTLARIMAKKVGCVGEDLDEKNCADFRGIDMVREIRDRIGLVPIGGSARVCIIDEAQKLAELIEAADLVTEMTLVKHHFAAGVKAQEGIEF